MSISLWPPVEGPELQQKWEETQQRELAWFVGEVLETCRDLKHGLDDCYALLAPIDPGSTLVMSTPRAEKVKGTITRVGTRIVKTALNLQLRTLPPQILNLGASHAIHVQPLDELHGNLSQAIDILASLLSTTDPSAEKPSGPALADVLSVLADLLSSSASLLKGPPLSAPDASWQRASTPVSLLAPVPPPGSGGPVLDLSTLSLYVCVQECCVVLWLRSLEAVDAPVHFGMKLGLAFGTVRRLEHDEMDKTFSYVRRRDMHAHPGPDGRSARHTPESRGDGSSGGGDSAEDSDVAEVFVREKVRVESADPSLISLYSKLGYMSNILGQARRNLAAVMGTDF